MANQLPHRPRRRAAPMVRPRRIAGATVVLALFVIVLLFTGGSSRANTVQLVVLRPAALWALAALTLLPLDHSMLRRLTVPLGLLGALSILIFLQLVPLPPGLWLWLSGHERFAAVGELAGEATWRPLSLTPERTWSSLLLLLAPLTVLIGYTALSEQARSWTLPLLIVVGLGSALLGVAQMLAGASGLLYLYPTREFALPTGFFANRNHQGVFLAILLPALRAWTLNCAAERQVRHRRIVLAGAVALFLVPTILVTQSRAGFGIMILGLVAMVLMEPSRDTASRRRVMLMASGALAVVAAFVALTLWNGRDTAFGRLIAGGGDNDIGRLAYIPSTVEMIRASFPFGYGFGSFDLVFRSFEPLAILKPTYVNNAHNDLLELMATGGLPALAILFVFLLWVISRARLILAKHSRAEYIARAAATMIVLLLFASLIDYPLRTPLMASILAFLVAWLAESVPVTEKHVDNDDMQSGHE